MSLRSTLSDLRKNKSDFGEFFRKTFHSKQSKFEDVLQVIELVTKELPATVYDTPSHLSKYIKLISIVLEYKPHLQHITIDNWAKLVQVLIAAFNCYTAHLDSLAFVKCCHDVFYCFTQLLSVRESICLPFIPSISQCCLKFIELTELRENSCTKLIMRIAYIISVLGIPVGKQIGESVLEIGRFRDPVLKYNVCAFACLYPQPLSTMLTLYNVDSILINANEIEFTNDPILNFNWFRPSAFANCSKFITALALSKTDLLHLNGPKRVKTDPCLKHMIMCFQRSPLVDTQMLLEDAKANTNTTSGVGMFWLFCLLARHLKMFCKPDKLSIWKLASEYTHIDPSSSGACYCLSMLIKDLAHPEMLDQEVLTMFKNLLLTIKGSVYPKFSSGALSLYKSFTNLRILDTDFQCLVREVMSEWSTEKLANLEFKLSTELFASCSNWYIDEDTYRDLREVQMYSNIEKQTELLQRQLVQQPVILSKVPPVIPVVPTGNATVTDCILAVALTASQSHPIPSHISQFHTDLIADSDFKSLVWFANLYCFNKWDKVYADCVLSFCNWSMLNESKLLAVEKAITVLSSPELILNIAVSGVFPEHHFEGTNLRALQPILQSYSLQTNTDLLCNIIVCINKYNLVKTNEGLQLVKFFMTMLRKQSMYTRLSSFLADLVSDDVQFLCELVQKLSFEDVTYWMVMYTLPKTSLKGLEQIPQLIADPELRKRATLQMIEAKVVGLTTSVMANTDSTFITSCFTELHVNNTENLLKSLSATLILLNFKTTKYLPDLLLTYESTEYQSELISLWEHAMNPVHMDKLLDVIELLLIDSIFILSQPEVEICTNNLTNLAVDCNEQQFLRLVRFITVLNSIVKTELDRVYELTLRVQSKELRTSCMLCLLSVGFEIQCAELQDLQRVKEMSPLDIITSEFPSVDDDHYNYYNFVFSSFVDKLDAMENTEIRSLATHCRNPEFVLKWLKLLGLVKNKTCLLFISGLQLSSQSANDTEVEPMSLDLVYKSLPDHKKLLLKPLISPHLKTHQPVWSLTDINITNCATKVHPSVLQFHHFVEEVFKFCSNQTGKPHLSDLTLFLVPEFTEYIPYFFASIPYYKLRDLLPTLVQGLASKEERTCRFLLKSLTLLYESQKQLLLPTDIILESCFQLKTEFYEFGIQVIELTWNKQHFLSNEYWTLLKTFYETLNEPGLRFAVAKHRGEFETSDMNKWQNLQLNLIKYDVLNEDKRLELLVANSASDAGLWNLAKKLNSSILNGDNFYDLKRAWWIGKWEFSLEDCEYFGNKEYAPLISFLGDKCDVNSTFIELTRMSITNKNTDSFEFVNIFSQIIAETRPQLCTPDVQHGRSMRFKRDANVYGLIKELEESSKQLRDSGDPFSALKYAIELEGVPNVCSTASSTDSNNSGILALTLSQKEQAYISQSLGDSSQAINQLKMLLTPPRSEFLNLPKTYTDLGTWSHLAKQESDADIMSTIFSKAVESAQTSMDKEYVHHNFAVFCDNRYNDPQLEESILDSQNVIKNEESQVRHLKKVITSASEQDKIAHKRYEEAKRLLKAERDVYNDLVIHKLDLLRHCLQNYLLSMMHGDQYEEDVARFISLWFENSSYNKINTFISGFTSNFNGGKVAIWKFIPWMNQLTSRLANSTSPFQQILSNLIIKSLQLHPYHTAWQLFNILKTGSRGLEESKQNDRRNAANKIWKSVNTQLAPKTVPILLSILKLGDAMVMVAKKQHSRGQKRTKFAEIGSATYKWWLVSLPKLRTPVPTNKIEVSPLADYTDVPYIISVRNEIDIAGGISAPKIVTLTTSDATDHKMILKSGDRDDLRQDAIMQQVFDTAKCLLLKRDPRLNLVTYMVIPLGSTVGAIEFVKNTKALQEVLVPLHEKYGGKEEYPRDTARSLMSKKMNSSRVRRIEIFNDVMKHTLPQMRHFWTENYKNIRQCLTNKSNWCRSNGIMSILGYIVGLGDRHCSNLLVNTVNGEVVHIDLGIAFDQGKLLSIPETVPFRLTRDMVDGMGPCGVSGVFTYAAETTLDLLRKERGRIMSVLNVLKHDTLYTWRLPALKRGFSQFDSVSSDEYANGDNGDNGDNVGGGSQSDEPGEADVALQRVNAKLNTQLNTEATVRELISQATDPQNLALIFAGWSPFY